MHPVNFSAELAVFCRKTHQLLRSCGRAGNLSQLQPGEYFSFLLSVENRDSQPLRFREAGVRVDGGALWSWAGSSVSPNDRGLLHIYPENMDKCSTPGQHTAIWYLDGRQVHRETFFLSRDAGWNSLFPIPSPGEIRAYRNPQKSRSPYLCGYLQVPRNVRYPEYQVDFRAGHLPRGTYCCLGSWAMDLSGLRRHYRSVPDMSARAYAGFQRIDDGRTVSIMSFWDIFCTDHAGRQITLRPKILYPDTQIGGGEFWGEGTGARCTAPYEWEAGHWYRMHLRCVDAPETGTTHVEQWVRDLHTGEKRLLSRYDTRIPNSAFLGNMAVFLENFLWETAGEVRSMEVRNLMYRREDTGKWHRFSQVLLDPQDGPAHGLAPYIGSYGFGVREDTVWMITCGAGGDWLHDGRGRKQAMYKIGPERRTL